MAWDDLCHLIPEQSVRILACCPSTFLPNSRVDAAHLTEHEYPDAHLVMRVSIGFIWPLSARVCVWVVHELLYFKGNSIMFCIAPPLLPATWGSGGTMSSAELNFLEGQQ